MSRAARPIALTARGRVALGCGLAAIAYGRLFGATEIALLGAMVVAAALLARVWVGLAGGPHIAVRTLPPFAHAGDRVHVAVELRPLEGARPGRAAFRESGLAGACALRPVSAGGLRVLRGTYELGPLPRGIRELGAGELVREDPFGLARRVDATRGSTELTVIAPPLALPDGVLSDTHEIARARRRLRSGGHELHGVREHQPGESLRGVHWPATAHHGRLMVKELDDPAGEELAIVLDARASGDIGASPDSSFELAVAAAGALAARAHADSRRVRVVVAGADGEPASATERAAVRRLLARVRPAGERSPADLVARLAAERVEVVTSRPAAFVGAGPARRLGIVAIDPSSYDPAVPRDDRALEALRAAGSRVLELRRPERVREAVVTARPRGDLGLRGALFALAAGYGLFHARDLEVPSLSAPRLAALALLATAPALVALRAGRRLGLLALAPAALLAAWISADHLPSPGAPLGGLGAELLDAPRAWVQVVLPFDGEHPELRAAVLIALFAWLAVLAQIWIARPRPLAAGLLALLPFALAATVYDLPQRPWRALLAGALLLAFLRSGRPEGGRAMLAVVFAALALVIGAGWSAVPAASRPALLPWTTWTFAHEVGDPGAVGLVWDMRYQPLVYPPSPVEVLQVRAARPSYWRATVLAGFDGLRFTRDLVGITETRGRGGIVRVPDAPAGPPLRARVTVTTLVGSFLIAPGQPARYALPPSAGAVDLGADGSAELSLTPAAGLAYTAEGIDRDPTAQALRSLPAHYPAAVAADLGFAGAELPAFGSAGREQRVAALFREHRGDPAWRAWEVAYAKARTVTRGASSPYQAVVALEAWLRTTRAYDDHASLPDRSDALARWAASGTAGYCQMFAASLAALARLSGVPARVAEGFATGDLRGGTYHVTDRDAHAWVEVWFPGYGWLPFDATPGRSLPERASSSSLSFDGAAAQARPSGTRGSGGLPALKLPLGRLRATGAAARSAASGGGAPWNGGLVLAVGLLALILAAAVVAKRVFVRLALPGDAASAARVRVGAFVADQGAELGPSLTPREFAGALERRFGVPAEGFASALERLAYAAPEANGRAGLERETAGLLAALRASLGRRRRLRGAFALRGLRGVSGARDRAR